MRRLTFLAIFAITTSVAFAGSTQNVDDPKDAPGRVDIKSVKVSHDAGKIYFLIKYYATVKAGEESSVAVLAGKFDRIGASYLVSSFGVTNGRGEKTGKSRMTRPDGKSVRYKINDSSIGSPASFKWQACVCIEGDRQDEAPAKPKKFVMAG